MIDNIFRFFNKSKYSNFYFLIGIFLFSLTNLLDINSIRQSTESLYITLLDQSTVNYLSAYGDKFFKQAPLLQAITKLFVSLFDSPIIVPRILIFAATLGVIFEISRHLAVKFTIPAYQITLFLCSSFGFVRYSKLFLPDFLSMCFITLGALNLYDWLEKKGRPSLKKSFIYIVLSVYTYNLLPFYTLFISSLIFYFLTYKGNRFSVTAKEIVLFFIVLLITISTPILVFSYFFKSISLTDYIFSYFGKGSRPYTNVIVGLFAYSFPWSLFLPAAFIFLGRNFSKVSTKKNFHFIFFILLNLLCTLSIWTIPGSHSFRYALASCFYLQILVLIAYFRQPRTNLFSMLAVNTYSLILFFFSVVGLFFFFYDFFADNSFSKVIALFATIVFISNLVVVQNQTNKAFLFTSSFVSLSLWWNFFIPQFILPEFPKSIKPFLESQQVAIIGKYTIYAEEYLDKDLVSLNHSDQVDRFLDAEDSVVIIRESKTKNIELADYEILATWPVWVKKTTPMIVYKAFLDNSTHTLKEKTYLITKK